MTSTRPRRERGLILPSLALADNALIERTMHLFRIDPKAPNAKEQLSRELCAVKKRKPRRPGPRTPAISKRSSRWLPMRACASGDTAPVAARKVASGAIAVLPDVEALTQKIQRHRRPKRKT